ncbi:MAG: AI-2E family transporter [Brachymonas sp.]|nr:AI-2E family transporter [Brachymonas sp.]
MAAPEPPHGTGHPHSGSHYGLVEPTLLTQRNISIASHVLVWLFLLLIMVYGLLPGLLSACLGFFLTRRLALLFVGEKTDSALTWVVVPKWSRMTAATAVMVLPLVLFGFAVAHSLDYLIASPHQYRELLNFMANTVLELRQKLPGQIADMLPAEAAGIQRVIARYLAAKAGSFALTGRMWLGGLLLVYVGLAVGALGAVRKKTSDTPGPLANHLHMRVRVFGAAFKQIVAAQFWIALFNTVMTAIFLLGVLPTMGVHIPYTPALITLTMTAGLIPIVGNLISNVVVTIVALSVSPIAAVACLSFLILIHKAEYAINAKVVGQSTHIGVWDLLAVMFVTEAIFGPAGLVAAPLFYAYLKKELQAVHLV